MNIDNFTAADIIDSRDIIARIEELEEDRAALVEDLHDAREAEALCDRAEDAAQAAADVIAARAELSEWDSENAHELDKLQAFRDEVSGYCADWDYGESLIAEDYFTDYIEELVKDCYSLDVPSFVAVDWDATAENCKVDYTSAELDGHTFYFR